MKGLPLIIALTVMAVALAGCTDNNGKDSDGDGVPDVFETKGFDSYVLLEGHSELRRYFSDPEITDTDGDGLSDWDETFARSFAGLPALDPSNVDTDGDGLTDCQEWYIQVGSKKCPVPEGFTSYDLTAYTTEAHAVDSDILLSPSRYVNYHLNDGTGYDDTEAGYDTSNGVFIRGDGISDYDEIFGYDIQVPGGGVRRGVTSDPFSVDTDGDGLEDGEEALRFGSDPNVLDTDGDGCDDSRDIFPSQPDTYRVRLDQFLLKEAPSGGTNARLFLITAIAAASIDDFQYQPARGSHDVNEGETSDLTSINIQTRSRSDCGTDADPTYRVAAAVNPWLVIQVAPAHKHLTGADDNKEAYLDADWTGLDVISQSAPDAANLDGRVFWNPQEDVFRWTLPEAPNAWRLETDTEYFRAEEGVLHFSGADGEIWFDPEVQLGAAPL